MVAQKKVGDVVNWTRLLGRLTFLAIFFLTTAVTNIFRTSFRVLQISCLGNALLVIRNAQNYANNGLEGGLLTAAEVSDSDR